MVVIGGLVLLTLTSSGWPEVRDTFFNSEIFKDSFPDILKAFWLDVRVFCIVEVVVLILGLVVALLRTTGAPALFPVRMLATVYTDVFRGIPTVLLVYLSGSGSRRWTSAACRPSPSCSAGSRSHSPTAPM